jgi:UDP-N-acetylglucosamine 2-epimerase
MKIKKIKLVTILGTRPEIIRLSRIIPKLDRFFDHILIHTGQNYDQNLNDIFFKDLKLRKPNFIFNNSSKNNIISISKILQETDKILVKFNPDAFFVLGDTNSALSAIVARKKKIPIFHYEAGNRCFDLRVPEESNRRIVDTISDINITYSKISREHLLREGFQSNRVINIGSPMKEILTHYKSEISKSKILESLKLTKKNYIVLSSHREENVDSVENFTMLTNIIKFLNHKYKYKVIVSVHPRIRDKIKNLSKKDLNKIIFCKPFSFTDYIKLQQNSKIVLSDSGTLNEESSILNFDAINLRNSHERPEADEEAVTLMTGLDLIRLSQAMEYIFEKKSEKKNIVDDYSKDNVSDKLVRIILNHINFINENNYKR